MVAEPGFDTTFGLPFTSTGLRASGTLRAALNRRFSSQVRKSCQWFIQIKEKKAKGDNR
jgi:hypothetical protein